MGRRKTVERVKKEALDNIVGLVEQRVNAINSKIWRNKHEINNLAEDTKVLKKERMKLTEMLRDLKPEVKE